MKTEYPVWFNALHPPVFFEKEPPEFKNVDSVLGHVQQNIYDFKTMQIPSGATHLDLEYFSGYEHDESEVKVTFYNCQTIKNLNLEKERARFEKSKTSFEKRLKEWQKWKTMWEADKVAAEEERELEILRKLKEKYEK